MANEIQMSNIPKMAVGKLTDYLTAAYMSLIVKGLPIKTLPPTMLWGPPGVGKSQLVRAVAENLERRSGKKVKVTDVRLLLYNPID
jgi:replication-associated recombination protein RarA